MAIQRRILFVFMQRFSTPVSRDPHTKTHFFRV